MYMVVTVVCLCQEKSSHHHGNNNRPMWKWGWRRCSQVYIGLRCFPPDRLCSLTFTGFARTSVVVTPVATDTSSTRTALNQVGFHGCRTKGGHAKWDKQISKQFESNEMLWCENDDWLGWRFGPRLLRLPVLWLADISISLDVWWAGLGCNRTGNGQSSLWCRATIQGAEEEFCVWLWRTKVHNQ